IGGVAFHRDSRPIVRPYAHARSGVEATSCLCLRLRELRGMLTDLDQLQHDRSIDAIIVPLHEAMHPAFRWIARGAKVTRGYAIKIAGREPVLVYYDMERDEAAACGLTTRSIHDYDYDRIFKRATSAS